MIFRIWNKKYWTITIVHINWSQGNVKLSKTALMGLVKHVFLVWSENSRIHFLMNDLIIIPFCFRTSPWICAVCGTAESPWICLTCGLVHCGRYINGDGMHHYEIHDDHPLTMDCFSYTVYWYNLKKTQTKVMSILTVINAMIMLPETLSTGRSIIWEILFNTITLQGVFERGVSSINICYAINKLLECFDFIVDVLTKRLKTRTLAKEILKALQRGEFAESQLLYTIIL